MDRDLKRRLLSTALALAICLTLLPPPVNAAAFPDVGRGAWYWTYVTELSDMSIITGCDDGLFHPEQTVTAGMAVMLITQAAGHRVDTVSNRHWASPWADHAVEHEFLPAELAADLDAAISRGDIARIAALALGLEPMGGLTPFSDADDGYLAALYDMGVISGAFDRDGRRCFFPESKLTRAELSALAWQVRRVHQHGKQILFAGRYYDIDPKLSVNCYDPQKFVLEGDRMTYTGDASVRTAQGIDVSAYQEEIDWERVAADGIQFAILRVGGRGYTKGTIYDDQYFEANLQGALAAGLEVGVYFFSQAITKEEALEEAEYVLDHIRGYELTYPVVFDWENISQSEARTDGLDADTLCAAANAFCTRVAREGFRPMVYFNLYIAYRKYDLGQIADRPFWLAQYTERPTFYYDFELWQYTSSGRVDGIEGPVDMDIRLFRAG